MRKINSIYDNDFYIRNKKFQHALAKKLVPWIAENLKPKSVIDFGCGSGVLLNEIAKACNVDQPDCYGLNFEVDETLKEYSNILEYDLSKKIKVWKKFDLAISLEVAEHIEESKADVYLKNIVNASNIILFSAATPGQGGEGHINEQPHEYWHIKFYDKGYTYFDIIRPLLKCDKTVPFWYRNNIFLYRRIK